MSRKVTLQLCSGQRFDGITIESLDQTLVEFLDVTLKQLEGQCKLTLPETDNDLIDSREFKVYNEDRKDRLPLDCPIDKITYITSTASDSQYCPVLILDSVIFRTAEEVEIDERVTRVRSGTSSSRKNRKPHPPTRSTSLGSKGMSEDHMIFLAGRKEYNGSLSNGSRWQPNSNQSDVTSLSDVNVSDDMLERYMTTTASVDESMSVQSYDSSVSDMSEVTLRKNRMITSTTTPRKISDYDIDSISSEGGRQGRESIRDSLSGLQLITNIEQVENQSNTINEESPRHAPKLLLKQTTLAEDEEINIDTATSTVSCGDTSNEARPPSTSSTEHNTIFEQPDTTNVPPPTISPPNESPKLNQRKIRLASRRNSNLPQLRPISLNENAFSPSSPRLRVVSLHEEPTSPRSRLSENKRTFRNSGSNRNRGVVISPHHTEVFGKIKQFNVEFDIVTVNLSVEMSIRGDYTVSQIKENLWQYLKELGHIVQEFDFLWDPEKFTFTYIMNEEIYELYDSQQIFQTSTVAQLWRQEKIQEKGVMGKLIVEHKKSETPEEKKLGVQISNMIGFGLYQLQFANNDELEITRRKMVSERRKAVRMRDKAMYSMEAEVHCSSLPPHILEAIGEQKKLLLKVYYSAGAYQTFQVDMHTTADELLEMAIPKETHKRIRLGIPEDCDINEHVLKVAGRDSYVHGNYELQEFTHIIKFVGKHKDIELWMVKKLDVNLDLPREVPDWNLIDESTGLTGTHEELSALSKEHTEVFTMSMWDIQRKFRVRVLGIDNLRNCLPDYDAVYVVVGIFHGGEELSPILSTNEVTAGIYPRWNQWVVFDTSVKNLPKAARLSVAVYGGVRRSDNKRRGSSTWGRKEKGSSLTKNEVQVDTTLHWVNMQILDHRSLLRQGVLKLNLWPNQSNTTDTQWGGMAPMGSTAINPDGNSAAVLYLELDTYMHPVACPTEGWSRTESSHSDHLHKESSPFRADIDKSISSDPLAPLLPADKELLWNFRSQLVISPEALPKFLRCVNWADLDQVTETHKLLKQWMPVTMDVALQLLDYHYADEKVRSLAVKRLSKLTNDELLVYFLQLIQVLKFESYHDSALARLLLGRALRSKRLGHYFFWYLRSEMDTPEFSQRFGILLEAYFKGCGETMFKELQNQYNAIHNLMSIAQGLKKHMEKHKGNVTEYVREELKNCKLPEYFAPPFEAGVRMGNLRIEKCRVMDSKKTPLWLEFENLDSAQISKRPIKIIAKHGDDLRQDMLTLQMLELMNGLWLSKGLDLYIIPYGCIATGDGMGIIEVVQEAETVAKIQVLHGGSLSAFKDEPLHDWLKKKNPNPLQFEKAVDRFMHSCAGYCVATYVLGIGDRHNDNIMLTTNGNLFHIDFGHFLGNTKNFMGYNRERAPFVLTPDFEYVMGKRSSETFHQFEEIAVKAYLTIRQNANLFINLFSMMKCTGIPELRSVKDIEYLRDVLVLNQTEQQAADHFRQQIQNCLKHQWSTQLNWLAHIIVHSKTS